MGTTTLSVQESTLERFNDIKEQLDDYQTAVPDHSADSFLNALLDTWEDRHDADAEMTVGVHPTLDESAIERLTTELEAIAENAVVDGASDSKIMSALETVEARTGRIERAVEELEGGR